MSRKIRLTMIMCMLTLMGFSQEGEVPVHFGQFFNNPLINPAGQGIDAKTEFYIGQKQNAGKLKGVRNSYAAAFFQIGEAKENYSVLGFQFNNGKEGPVLRRNRGYLSYSRHQRLSDTWRLAIGISGGFYNFGVKSNPATGGISAGTFDGNSGVTLYNDNSFVGLSINQLSSSTVKPLDQEIFLAPQYNLVAKRLLVLKTNLWLKPSIILRYSDAHGKLKSSLAMNLFVRDLISFGASYENDEGFYAFFGLQNINLSRSKDDAKRTNKIDIDLAYFLPNFSNTRTQINSVELSLKYFINNASE